MSPVIDAHEHARDLAEEYALGVLSAEDGRWVTDHLVTCQECRQYINDLRAVTFALARSMPADEAPPELRASLLAAATRRPTPMLSRRRWGSWAVGAVAAAVIAGLGIETAVTRRQLDATRKELDAERTVAAAIVDGQRVVRLAPVSGSGPGALWVQPASGSAFLIGPNLASLPDDRTYELWFLVGSAALPAGTFQPNDVLSVPPLPRGTTGLAVTVESHGGSAKPTSAPIMVGKV